MLVSPYQQFPFSVPRTFSEFFSIVQRAFLATHHPKVAPSKSDQELNYGAQAGRAKPNIYALPKASGHESSRAKGLDASALKLVSISLPLVLPRNNVDPDFANDVSTSTPTLSLLAALEILSKPTEQHFYWEKQNIGDAIAAVGCVVEQQISGININLENIVGDKTDTDRFIQTQQILDKWFAATTVLGALDVPFAGPHAFCRFTFFDQGLNGITNHPFPPASVFIPKWHIGQHHNQRVFVANIARTKPHREEIQQLRQKCLDLWQIYQQLQQSLDTPQITISNPTFCRRGASAHQSPVALPISGDALHPEFDRITSATTSSSIFQPAALSLVLCREIEDLDGSWEFTLQHKSNEILAANPLSTDSLGTDSLSVDSSNVCLSSTVFFRLPSQQKDAFKQSVQAALEVIETTDIEKVVLAQHFDVEVDTPFQVFPSLHNLRTGHKDCHIFSTANGQGQVFLGASPERLLSIRDRTLYTEAIAGSAPRGTTPAADEKLGHSLLGNIKELHEHQLVVNYLTQQLTELKLEPQRSPFPKLLQLPNIQHLHTPISAKLPLDLNALDIVSHLHPTPAVAGVPQDVACELIQQQEAFERSLYAAPIGWINYQGDSEFIVGIRSALLDGHTSRLYAGAGIVQGSEPNLEASEIELKLQAMLTTLLF
ncbi:MAG: isochorismate synthase [Cyanobacteria bacterium P01_F01_bin.150]